MCRSLYERHNADNMHMTCAQSLSQFEEIISAVEGSGIYLNGTLDTAFFCPYEGWQPFKCVLWTIETYRRLGIDGITLADMVGAA